jgi:hypothetical protein
MHGSFVTGSDAFPALLAGLDHRRVQCPVASALAGDAEPTPAAKTLERYDVTKSWPVKR